jgi:hypothetical protein
VRGRGRHRLGGRPRLPWFLLALGGRGCMASRGGGDDSRARPPPRSATPSSSKPSCTPSSSDAAACGTSATPSSSVRAVAATPTPTSATPSSSDRTAAATPTPSGQAEPTQHACDDGTAIVIVDDNVPVGGKRKCKSEVWLEFVEIVVGGKVKAEYNWCKNC